MGVDLIQIKRGLTLPFQAIPSRLDPQPAPTPSSVAILGHDYPNLKPRMMVKEGDSITTGQVLVEDKGLDDLPIVAPIAGVVKAIHRGQRRRLLSVVITPAEDAEPTCQSVKIKKKRGGELDADSLREALVAGGLWSRIRQRPYDRIPSPKSAPAAIFVTAMDTRPLAVDPCSFLNRRSEDFEAGVAALTQLTSGKVHICHALDADLPSCTHDRVQETAFSGDHPAGLAGTHIHHLEAASVARPSWYLDARDVVVIGHLVRSDTLDFRREVLCADLYSDKPPRLLEVVSGASLSDLFPLFWQFKARVISGSPIYGHLAKNELAWLGHYHYQACNLPAVGESEFLNWAQLGLNKHSALNVFASSIYRAFGLFQSLGMNTGMHGAGRGMVPVGVYDQVMPLDIAVTHLLRAIVVGDTERAQQLGVLELGPEDMSLLTYACPSKYDYCSILREQLQRIESEG